MTKLTTKVSHALKETTVILPGTQALLGFQLVAFFSNRFSEMSQALQNLHLASLFCVVLATILLMGIVAYHRIAEDGEDTQQFHRYISVMHVLSLAALGAGLVTDLVVVTRFLTDSAVMAAWTGLVTGVVAILVWYVIPVFSKLRN